MLKRPCSRRITDFMSSSPFQQLLRHRRSLALATLFFWALCALLAGCLIGLSSQSGSTSMSVPMVHEHTGHTEHGHDGRGITAAESVSDLACCETGHDPAPLTVLSLLALAVGLPLAFLLPLLSGNGAGWRRQPFHYFRIRPPRYHLVYCSFLH
ncbi:hypothetical protein LPB19_04800 [Marinobacter salinisoli]|uniref:DUF2946 domain-containing protein n=1 Tax=Marinobacter salinisoli TaxID=2769486 RepID=A0ABX7MWA2_9GAMM|nr:hypothetical protein [Marinobacter salinisoli]QSP95735.1 hypothetical protein LPB19_04800 [Marinobacter salinisoli]